MGFRVDKYAKVWKIYPKNKADQKYTDVQISTSNRVKKGEYQTDFSDNARLIGDAHTKADNLEANDRIKILSCEVKNKYDRDKNRNYYTFCIYDFEFDDNKKQEKSNAESKGEEWVNVDNIPDNELPFAD